MTSFGGSMALPVTSSLELLLFVAAAVAGVWFWRVRHEVWPKYLLAAGLVGCLTPLVDVAEYAEVRFRDSTHLLDWFEVDHATIGGLVFVFHYIGGLLAVIAVAHLLRERPLLG